MLSVNGKFTKENSMLLSIQTSVDLLFDP